MSTYDLRSHVLTVGAVPGDVGQTVVLLGDVQHWSQSADPQVLQPHISHDREHTPSHMYWCVHAIKGIHHHKFVPDLPDVTHCDNLNSMMQAFDPRNAYNQPAFAVSLQSAKNQTQPIVQTSWQPDTSVTQ